MCDGKQGTALFHDDGTIKWRSVQFSQHCMLHARCSRLEGIDSCRSVNKSGKCASWATNALARMHVTLGHLGRPTVPAPLVACGNLLSGVALDALGSTSSCSRLQACQQTSNTTNKTTSSACHQTHKQETRARRYTDSGGWGRRRLGGGRRARRGGYMLAGSRVIIVRESRGYQRPTSETAISESGQGCLLKSDHV